MQSNAFVRYLHPNGFPEQSSHSEFQSVAPPVFPVQMDTESSTVKCLLTKRGSERISPSFSHSPLPLARGIDIILFIILSILLAA